MAPNVDVTAPRPQRADARRNRERILKAAAKEIGARGLDVQMEDIARAAGVGVGTIYRNFPTKQALQEALWDEKRRRVIDVAERAALNPDPWGAVEQLFTQGTDLQLDDLGWCQALGLPGPQEPPAELRAPTTKVLERAKQAGVLRSDFGIEDVGSVFGAMSTVVSNGGRAARDSLLKVILDGLRPR